MVTGLILLAVLAAVVGFGIVGFNKLRKLDVSSLEALGGIDVQLTRRADLIPNLVNTVKGYAQHEKGVFEEVTKARAGVQAAAQGGSVEEKASAQARLDRAIVDVLAVAEAYPDLKATVNFQQLQTALTDTENQLAFARQFYNDAVSQQNTAVRTIPWLLFTGIAGVHAREFYNAPDGQEAPPTVSFEPPATPPA
jgi:LemA protein